MKKIWWRHLIFCQLVLFLSLLVMFVAQEDIVRWHYFNPTIGFLAMVTATVLVVVSLVASYEAVKKIIREEQSEEEEGR
jgi:Na+/H+ antiporter NhaD/arsenite permease-like protein